MDVRVVFAVQSSDERVLRSCRNLIAAAEELVLADLVCFGDGVRLCLTDSAAATAVADLLEVTTGPGGAVTVRMWACANALNGHGIDAAAEPSPLIDGVRVVPAGVLKIAQLQQDGAAYLSV